MSEFTCQTEDALPHNKTNAASNSTKVRMQLLTLFNTTSVVDLSGRASNISASQTLMATSAAKLPNPSSVFNVSNTPFMSSNVSSPSALSLPPPLFSSNASVGYCQSYFASANLTATSCLSTETWWQTPCSCDATLLTTLNSLPLVCLPTLTPTDLQTLLIFLADFQAPCSGFSGVSIGCQQQLQTVLYPTNTCIQAAQTNATAMATCFCEQDTVDRYASLTSGCPIENTENAVQGAVAHLVEQCVSLNITLELPRMNFTAIGDSKVNATRSSTNLPQIVQAQTDSDGAEKVNSTVTHQANHVSSRMLSKGTRNGALLPSVVFQITKITFSLI